MRGRSSTVVLLHQRARIMASRDRGGWQDWPNRDNQVDLVPAAYDHGRRPGPYNEGHHSDMDDPLFRADPWGKGSNPESAERNQRPSLPRQKPVDGINVKSCLITHNQARNREESKAQCAPSEYGRRNPASLDQRASSTNSDGFVVLSSQGSTCAESARTSSQ